MLSLNRLPNIITKRLYRRTIALVQVIVMVMLAVPVCCYELELDHEKAGIGQSAKANDADHSNCPCCPEEKKTDSNNDNCSTCSYCTYYTPLTTVISINYDPSVAPLIFQEQFTKLTDVHIPIFVPPQNLA
jgi:hypothetical protein